MKAKLQLTALILSSLFLISCSPSEHHCESNSRIIDSFSNVGDTGMLYSDSAGRLNFLDFDSMRSAVLCSRPNCTHDDPETCSSYGMKNHPILYGDDLFFFSTESVDRETDGRFERVDVTTIYKAAPDGTNRIAQQVIDELSMPIIRMVLVGDTAYFSMTRNEYDEYGTGTGYEEAWLCSYSLSANEFRKIEKIYEGYHAGTWMYGFWDDRIYFNFAYADEQVPYPFSGNEEGGQGYDAEASQKYMEDILRVTVTEYKFYDTKTDTINDSDLPEPLYIGDGYYVYEKEGAVAVIPENGKETLFEDFLPLAGGVKIYGGIMFNYSRNLCADLVNGAEIKNLNREEGQTVIAYYNGSFILEKNSIDDSNGTVTGTQYEKVAFEQLIAE